MNHAINKDIEKYRLSNMEWEVLQEFEVILEVRHPLLFPSPRYIYELESDPTSRDQQVVLWVLPDALRCSSGAGTPPNHMGETA